jgi:hypothetical protein
VTLDPADLAAAIVFLVAVVALAVVAVRLGMLVAPRVDRMTEPADEDEGADD